MEENQGRLIVHHLINETNDDGDKLVELASGGTVPAVAAARWELRPGANVEIVTVVDRAGHCEVKEVSVKIPPIPAGSTSRAAAHELVATDMRKITRAVLDDVKQAALSLRVDAEAHRSSFRRPPTPKRSKMTPALLDEAAAFYRAGGWRAIRDGMNVSRPTAYRYVDLAIAAGSLDAEEKGNY